MRLSVALVRAAATLVASIEVAPSGYGESGDVNATWEAVHGGPAPEYDFEEDNSDPIMARGVKHAQNMPTGTHKHHHARDLTDKELAEDEETYQMLLRNAMATSGDPTEPTGAVPGNLGIPKATGLTQAFRDLYDRIVGMEGTAAKTMRHATDDDKDLSLYDYEDPSELLGVTGKDVTEAHHQAQGPPVEEEFDLALLEARDVDVDAEDDDDDSELALERRALAEELSISVDDGDDGEEMGGFDDREHAEHEKHGLEGEHCQDFHHAEDLPKEENDGEMGEMGEFADKEHAEHEKRGLGATKDEISAYSGLEGAEYEKRDIKAKEEMIVAALAAGDDIVGNGGLDKMDELHAEHEKRGLDATKNEMSAYPELPEEGAENENRSLEGADGAEDDAMMAQSGLLDDEDDGEDVPTEHAKRDVTANKAEMMAAALESNDTMLVSGDDDIDTHEAISDFVKRNRKLTDEEWVVQALAEENAMWLKVATPTKPRLTKNQKR